MNKSIDNEIAEEYYRHIADKNFPCVAARAAQSKKQVECFVVGNMYCPKDDPAILKFLYQFVDTYRLSGEMFHSAAILFKNPLFMEEETFDKILWQRLQSLYDLDKEMYSYDKRVSEDPTSPDFSFSIKEEAFFVIGLHPGSSRPARQFKYPTLVFNPHAQFETLRKTGSYDKLKNVVRKRDIITSGSVNPMLEDYGNSSEVYQYSGRKYTGEWECPLNIKHARI